MTEQTDHDKPHYCDHDGGDALVAPPRQLFYIGEKWSTDTLITRDCPYSSRNTLHLPEAAP